MKKAIRHSASVWPQASCSSIATAAGAMPVIEEPLGEGSIVVIEEKRVRVRRLSVGGAEWEKAS